MSRGEAHFVIQGLWSDGRIAEEATCEGTEERAIHAAKRLLDDPLFEGDGGVRIITSDGEFVWSSRGES